MPKECTLCTAVKREEINKVLDGGASLRDVSRTYGFSKSSVDRHRRACLPGIKARAKEMRLSIQRNVSVTSPDEASPFIARVEDHATKMELIRDSAMKNNDDKTAIAAGREVRGAYEVLGKATGAFQSMFGEAGSQAMFMLPPGTHVAVTVNTSTSPREVEPERNVTPSPQPTDEVEQSEEKETAEC